VWHGYGREGDDDKAVLGRQLVQATNRMAEREQTDDVRKRLRRVVTMEHDPETICASQIDYESMLHRRPNRRNGPIVTSPNGEAQSCDSHTHIKRS
jgi:hypothetical protein